MEVALKSGVKIILILNGNMDTGVCCDKENITEVANCNIDFGTIYGQMGWVCSDLKKREDDSLTWAGKIMGLCG